MSVAPALAVGNMVGDQMIGQLSRHIDPARFRPVVIAARAILTAVFAIKECT